MTALEPGTPNEASAMHNTVAANDPNRPARRLSANELAELAGTVVGVIDGITSELLHQYATLPAPATDFASFVERFRAIDDPLNERLRVALAAIVPEAVWGAEFDDDIPTRGTVWVCDAIDGAVQFLQRLPHWCTTVTLVSDGEPVLCVVASPLRGDTYTAVRGGGAWLNGVRSAPRRRPTSPQRSWRRATRRSSPVAPTSSRRSGRRPHEC